MTSFREWHAWLFEHLYHVPAAQHLRLAEQEDELGRAVAEARERGEEEQVLQLHVLHVQAGQELADFVMKRLKRPEK